MRAHGEKLGDIGPAVTLVQAGALVGPNLRVEIEAHAVIDERSLQLLQTVTWHGIESFLGEVVDTVTDPVEETLRCNRLKDQPDNEEQRRNNEGGLHPTE